MTINERVRYLRKELLHMTMAEFGAAIGFSTSAISSVENGANNVSLQLSTAIVQRYGVSKSWLLEEEGDPFPPRSREEEIAAFLAAAQNGPPDSIKMRLLSIMARLDEDDWEALARIAQKIAAENEPEN